MPHIHLGFLIPVIYSFGKTTSLKIMNLKTTLQIKAPKNVGGKKCPQQNQQDSNNSWLRFVFAELHSKSCVGFICFKFRA